MDGPLDLSILDRVPLGLFALDQGFAVRFWNSCMRDWSGISSDEILGKDIRVFFPRLADERYMKRIESVLEGGPPVIFSYQLHGDLFPNRRQTGVPKVRHTTVSYLPETDLVLALFAVEDRTEAAFRGREARAEVARRAEAENELRAALAMKEMLIREVNHRVKNNLAMIASLVRLQSDRIDDPKLRAALSDLESRISSIALLYDRLYRSSEAAGVNLDEYLDSLCRTLFDNLLPKDTKIQFELHLERAFIGVDTGLYIGLLVAEFFTNSIKYGIGDRRDGRIEVSLRCDASYIRVGVMDDGPGFPSDPGQMPENLSLGLKLAQVVASSLGGRIEFGPGFDGTVSPGSGPGAYAGIVFPRSADPSA